jgi:hypothetical protein
LIIGVYNKLVKLHGSDAHDGRQSEMDAAGQPELVDSI